MYLCGTPREFCTGSPTTVNSGLRGKDVSKTHGSPEGCFGCCKNYLVNVLKYVKVDSRAFAPPDGGPVRVLTKPCRFGAKLRNGKEGTRNMPHVTGHGAGARGGTIISS